MVVDNHTASVNGTELHYISAGTHGSPVLLVHGFPESWWTFHRLIPLLAERHRVFAVDLRGFGDSAPAGEAHDSATAAQDLAALIARLDVGPVHLTGQDISGPTTFRLAAAHPELVRTFTAIETGLPGFGLEQLADVAWHIRALATPSVPQLFLEGRERALVSHLTPFTGEDRDVIAAAYARPGGFNGAAGLYRSLLTESEEIRALPKLTQPVLTIGGGSGDFTAAAFRNVADDLRAITLDGTGHYLALEAPERLAEALRTFWRS
ncbi:alpha/beta hydrolase [Solirubrobacter phytolaccae]|uniref:Alpha/beta hydrolase n=1 Tax=Solirubrobacter phytolaccae TaxID=1404360 RepID=A0A9X3SF99_9ACTN|nr:alpha/beta hydrolase [Solirubrobacter phytolaccae]MDA0181202.1 alpha/beta hydrolase [Solirubrobacter phytolaccae]